MPTPAALRHTKMVIGSGPPGLQCCLWRLRGLPPRAQCACADERAWPAPPVPPSGDRRLLFIQTSRRHASTSEDPAFCRGPGARPLGGACVLSLRPEGPLLPAPLVHGARGGGGDSGWEQRHGLRAPALSRAGPGAARPARPRARAAPEAPPGNPRPLPSPAAGTRGEIGEFGNDSCAQPRMTNGSN